MEPLKSIKLDIDRILLQLLIPGIFAGLPFFLIFLNTYPDAMIIFKKSEGMCTTVLFIISITIGLFLEDLGAIIEYRFDKRNIIKYKRDENRDTENEWHQYLQLNISSEKCDIVAQRYVRSILIRMKFELSFCVSLIIMSIGLLILNLQISFIDSWFIFIILCILLPLVLSTYLLWEIRNSTRLLIKVRKLILEKKC